MAASHWERQAGAARRSVLVVLAALAATLLLATARADAAVDVYMKTTNTNLAGESRDTIHKDWIELDSFRWHGVTRASRDAQPTYGVFEFEKEVDRSSPYFALYAASGTVMGSALISVRRANDPYGGTGFDRYCLEMVMVMSDTTSSGGERPTEKITLSYTKFARYYKAEDGTQFRTGWDTLLGSKWGFNPQCGGVQDYK